MYHFTYQPLEGARQRAAHEKRHDSLDSKAATDQGELLQTKGGPGPGRAWLAARLVMGPLA